jgi:hypothetical protein
MPQRLARDCTHRPASTQGTWVREGTLGIEHACPALFPDCTGRRRSKFLVLTFSRDLAHASFGARAHRLRCNLHRAIPHKRARIYPIAQRHAVNNIPAVGASRFFTHAVHSATGAWAPTRDPAATRMRGRSDRRVHRRLTAPELKWLREARLKYGPAVRIIDVSAGGALVETQVQLRPNSAIVLQLTCTDLGMVVPSRVLRCHVSALHSGLWYRSAFAFTRSLNVPDLLVPSPQLLDLPPGDYVHTEFALKTIVDRYIELEDCDEHDATSNPRTMLLDALQLLRASAEQRTHPSDRKLAAMLSAVVSVIQGRASVSAALLQLQQQLRQTLPLLSIGISGLPIPPSDGAESIYFDLTADSRRPARVLNVQFAAGFVPDAAQFRLLKTAAYVVTLLRACGPPSKGVAAAVPAVSSEPIRIAHDAAAQAQPAATSAIPPAAGNESPATAREPIATETLPEGWHRIVVRFVDGKLLRGYTNDFQPWSAQLRLRSSPMSTADPLLVPLAQLKAVFFVKDLSGDSSHVDQADFDAAAHGRKMEVTFNDGEVLLGTTLNYQANGQGFFLAPADSTGNNLRVYVISASVRHARFLPRG